MLASGIISCVFGILIIVSAAAQLFVDAFIAYAAAIWILVHGIIAIVRAFKVRKVRKDYETRFFGKHWWIGLVIGLLMLLFGILSLMNPTIIAKAIGLFIGLGIIVAGANLITSATAPADKGE